MEGTSAAGYRSTRPAFRALRGDRPVRARASSSMSAGASGLLELRGDRQVGRRHDGEG